MLCVCSLVRLVWAHTQGETPPASSVGSQRHPPRATVQRLDGLYPESLQGAGDDDNDVMVVMMVVAVAVAALIMVVVVAVAVLIVVCRDDVDGIDNGADGEGKL